MGDLKIQAFGIYIGVSFSLNPVWVIPLSPSLAGHPPFHLHNVKDSAIKGAGIGNHLNRVHTKFPLNC